MRHAALLLAALIFTSCTTPATVTLKPNIHPVVVSNQQTRASIKVTQKNISDARKSIKDAQDQQAKGLNRLSDAEADLAKLLQQP